jgi:hypothetical protein
VATLANATASPCLAQILTTGNLIGLHKLNADDRKRAEEHGEPPALRPVNLGCCLLKWAFMLAVRSPEARKAMEKFTPLQLGMSKRGAEAYCHSLRALWENGFAILKNAFRNCFNEISRQAVLNAVQTRCPELTSLFNLFYTCESACLFSVGDATKVVWSREGVRMGCPLGSFGFDLALQAVGTRRCSRKRVS